MSEYYLTKDELYHHGIKGQKWGERRFQNDDGSLTAAGRERYGYGEAKQKMLDAKANYKQAQKAYGKAYDNAINLRAYGRLLTKSGRADQARREGQMVKAANAAEKARTEYKQAKKDYKNSDEYNKVRSEKIKKAAKIGAAVVATAVAAYGAYKVHEIIKQKQYDKAMNLIKTAKFQDTLHGRYRDIAANYGVNYGTRYDGINGIKKDTYDYNISSGPTTKLEYNVNKYKKYYDKAESARIKSGTAANKANSQYIKYLGGSLTSKGRKLKKDLATGNSSFDANNIRKYRNAG